MVEQTYLSTDLTNTQRLEIAQLQTYVPNTEHEKISLNYNFTQNS